MGILECIIICGYYDWIILVYECQVVEWRLYIIIIEYVYSQQVNWQIVESIELVNDGSGLGFGIVGGRTTGVVVKTILPGGVADRVRS